MRPDGRDAASLWDMLQAAESIGEFTRGVSLAVYRENQLVRRAVERELEIAGEAARRISEGYRSAHPEVPWRRIIALRNFVTHVYDAVDDERIWRLAQNEVPQLAKLLRGLTPEPPPPDSPQDRPD